MSEIESLAWECDNWPEWLHDIVDRLDMSSEQAIAYAVLSVTESQRFKLARNLAQDSIDPDNRLGYSWEEADDIWRKSWLKKAAQLLK